MIIPIAIVGFIVGFLIAWFVPVPNEGDHASAHSESDAQAGEESQGEEHFAPDSEDPHLTVAEAKLKAEAETRRAENRAREAESRASADREALESGKARLDEKLGLVYESEPEDADDLTKIKGVAAVLNGKLNAFGVYKYRQIASWSPGQVGEFSERLSFKDRIAREDWIAQCSELHREKYGEEV